ncbi:MAG: DUF433 domain-containing protein [Actinobacteria bacterium]|nr:DUF433 domain-containing protein [Actinomycetota bacterium]
MPSEGIVIDPAIQAGSPCVEGPRVPVSTIVGMLGDCGVTDVAEELDLSPKQVRLAKSFDDQLAGGVGLAA